MKRSEKIEIRVSLEEKQALADIAKQEGRPVSRLVREVLGKYISLNAPAFGPQLRLPKLAAVLAIGLLAGCLIPIGLMKAQDEPVYYVQGVVDACGFGFPINLDIRREKSVHLGDGQESLYVFVGLENGSKSNLRVKFCYDDAKDCKIMAKASVSLDPQSPSVWQTQGADGEQVFVTVQRMAPNNRFFNL